MKFGIYYLLAIVLIIGVVTSQPMIREKRRARDVWKKIGDSFLPAFGAAAGSRLGERAGSIRRG